MPASSQPTAGTAGQEAADGSVVDVVVVLLLVVLVVVEVVVEVVVVQMESVVVSAARQPKSELAKRVWNDHRFGQVGAPSLYVLRGVKKR
jgi:hypothetical protein